MNNSFCLFSPEEDSTTHEQSISIISSVVWNKYTRVDFSWANEIARAQRVQFVVFEKFSSAYQFIPNCTRKIKLLLILNNTMQ